MCELRRFSKLLRICSFTGVGLTVRWGIWGCYCADMLPHGEIDQPQEKAPKSSDGLVEKAQHILFLCSLGPALGSAICVRQSSSSIWSISVTPTLKPDSLSRQNEDPSDGRGLVLLPTSDMALPSHPPDDLETPQSMY